MGPLGFFGVPVPLYWKSFTHQCWLFSQALFCINCTSFFNLMISLTFICIMLNNTSAQLKVFWKMWSQQTIFLLLLLLSEQIGLVVILRARLSHLQLIICLFASSYASEWNCGIIIFSFKTFSHKYRHKQQHRKPSGMVYMKLCTLWPKYLQVHVKKVQYERRSK